MYFNNIYCKSEIVFHIIPVTDNGHTMDDKNKSMLKAKINLVRL